MMCRQQACAKVVRPTAGLQNFHARPPGSPELSKKMYTTEKQKIKMKKRKGRERKNKVAHPQHTPTQALSPEITVPPHPAPQPSSQEPQPTPPQQPAMPFAEEMQMLRQQLEDRLQQQQREQQQQQREQQQQLQKQQLKTAILIKPRVRNAAACILKVLLAWSSSGTHLPAVTLTAAQCVGI